VTAGRRCDRRGATEGIEFFNKEQTHHRESGESLESHIEQQTHQKTTDTPN
jgi:hypothetical protein